MVDDKGFDGDDEEQTAATPTEKSSNARPQSASTSARRRAQRELTKPQGQRRCARSRPAGWGGEDMARAARARKVSKAKKQNDAGRCHTADKANLLVSRKSYLLVMCPETAGFLRHSALDPREGRNEPMALIS